MGPPGLTGDPLSVLWTLKIVKKDEFSTKCNQTDHHRMFILSACLLREAPAGSRHSSSTKSCWVFLLLTVVPTGLQDALQDEFYSKFMLIFSHL